MIFKGLNSVISLLLALSLLSGSLTIFYYEMGSSLEIIFGKIISEKLYNNAQLATVGVKSTATYTIPTYTRVGFHDVKAMDGNTGSIVYSYQYEPYNSIRNKLQFVDAILHNAELLLSAGIGEAEGDLARIKSLNFILGTMQKLSEYANWVLAHLSGNIETVKGGNAYYIPMTILKKDDGVKDYTTPGDGGESYTITMERVMDFTANQHIIYWNITQG